MKVVRFKIKDLSDAFVPGMIMGVVALVFVHVLTPYLNHPLGIGYLLLCSSIFYALKK